MSERPAISANIRRAVLIESSHRCAITACQNSENLDLHHIIPWATCKEHKTENLITLCPNCHRKAHNGTIDRKSLREYKKICKKDIGTFVKFKTKHIEVLDSTNIDSIICHTSLEFSVQFTNHFENEEYLIHATGTGSVSYTITEKKKSEVYITFEKPLQDIIKLEFTD